MPRTRISFPASLIALAGLAVGWGLPFAAVAATVQLGVETDAGKPLAGAIVFLESREARAAAKPAQGVEIAQVARQFSPQVTVVPVGTSVQFPNRDTVRHHVYSFSPAKNFELKLYTGTDANPVVFDKPGIAVLGCNIHDNMAAWVVVVETPYYARSDANGRATLDNVPAGNYRLRVWHAGLPVGAPASDQPLALAATGTALTVRLAGVVQ
jgi:plastocyanin